MNTALGAEAIAAALGELEGWTHVDDCLSKTFRFGGFAEAISFVVRLAFVAEQMGHHPELHNVYDRVDITLRTHDAGDRVTQKDLDLAAAIEGFCWV